MDFKMEYSKSQLERFLSRDKHLNMYSLGDLDNRFWGHNIWYSQKNGKDIRNLIQIYTGFDIPTLISFPEDLESYKPFFDKVAAYLPVKLMFHLLPDTLDVYKQYYQVSSLKRMLNMGLKDTSSIKSYQTEETIPLKMSHITKIKQLYAEAYPDNYFDPEMLKTGMFYGILIDNRLVSIAGIHVYSPRYKIAALGSITTHPDYRNRGFAGMLVAKVCSELLKKVDTIGLNVSADNGSAIHLYEKLGFVKNKELIEGILHKQ
jgi:RimJ/RimL family protein N-acetyltransferase